MAGPDDKIVMQGSWGVIKYASRPNKTRPAEEFYDSRTIAEKAVIANRVKWLADVGRITNRTKFKQVEDDLYAIKTGAGSRVGCYQNGRCWYLLDGFTKKGRKWPKGKVIHMQNLLQEHRGQ